MPETREQSPHPVLLTGLAAAGFGLAELAWRVHAGGPLESGSLLVGAALVGGVYGLIGVALGALARVLGALGVRVLQGPESAPALALTLPVLATLLAQLWSGWAPPATRALQLGMALAFTAVAFTALRALLLLGPRGTASRATLALAALSVLALLAAPLRHRHAESEKRERNAPSALLVTIDTLRADHVGAYGHAPARTPTIDALAEDGYLFEWATAPCVLTAPSHTSMLSGLLPLQHGVIENVHPVGHEVRTVAETLSGAGWDTAAFVSGYPVSNRASGLLGRFDHFDDDMRGPAGGLRRVPRRTLAISLGRLAHMLVEPLGVDLDPHWRKAPRVTDSAVAWMERGGDRPFFAWVHYFDPHLPYEAPSELVDPADRAFDGPRGEGWYELDADGRRAVIESEAAVARMGRLYDAEVALVDRELARLVEAARRRAGGDLWVIVTSDHGESFGEHGIWYRRELYDPSLHVPLVVVPPEAPAGRGGRIAEQVRLIDLAPTLLDVLGLPGEFPTEGRSLTPLFAGSPAEAPGPSVAAIFTSRAEPYQRFMLSVRNGRWKSIWRSAGWLNTDAMFTGETRELYDLESDPGELHNLADELPELWERLRSMAGEVQLELRSSETLSGEDLEILRSLGYTL